MFLSATPSPTSALLPYHTDTSHRGFLPAHDAARITRRIMRDHGMSEARAEAILRATLDYLAAVTVHPEMRLAPSTEVDKGWHTFLLYTKAYRAFCQGLGRQFIDHEPNDGAEPAVGGYARTWGILQGLGLAGDASIWPLPKAVCTDADCTSDDCDATSCFPVDDK